MFGPHGSLQLDGNIMACGFMLHSTLLSGKSQSDRKIASITLGLKMWLVGAATIFKNVNPEIFV